MQFKASVSSCLGIPCSIVKISDFWIRLCAINSKFRVRRQEKVALFRNTSLTPVWLWSKRKQIANVKLNKQRISVFHLLIKCQNIKPGYEHKIRWGTFERRYIELSMNWEFLSHSDDRCRSYANLLLKALLAIAKRLL